MNKAPAFQFYPDKWEAHTKHLSDYSYRVYHRLMCWMWLHDAKKCSCPVEHTAIAVLLAEPIDRIETAMAEIQNPHMPLLKERGDKYVMDGLRSEAKKQREWRRKSAKGGRTSRKCNADKDLGANHPLTTLQPKGQPKGNTPSPSPSLSPSVDIRERETTPIPPRGFAEFWAVYPVKKGKANAIRAWKRKKCGPITDTLLYAIDEQRKWPEWTKDGGKYIPYPATWINGGRWDDERAPDCVGEESEPDDPNAPDPWTTPIVVEK